MAGGRTGHRKNARSSKAVFYGLILAMLILILVTGAVVIGFFRMHEENVISHVTIECGETVSRQDFFREQLDYTENAEFTLDLSIVDTNIPQDVEFDIRIMGQSYPTRLTVVDTLAPTCTVVPQRLFANQPLPDVSECLTDVFDIQQPVTMEYMTEPDMSKSNTSIVYCKLEDPSGNISVVEVPFYITKDYTAPVIEGVHNFTQYAGDPIAYRDGITITDDIDPEPVLTIDNSGVDLESPGEYTVYYTATDAAGNSSYAEAHVTLWKKPATYVEPSTLWAAARQILNKITTPDMSDMQKALKIFRWCRYNLNYMTSANIDTTSFNRVAYDGLTKRYGSCYTFAVTASALLDACGIENRIVVREPWRHAVHYWNLIKIDGQWYHCDSTPRKNYNSYLFMYTDRELANFWVDNYNGYSFDHNKQPASATQSVQSRINYAAGTIR